MLEELVTEDSPCSAPSPSTTLREWRFDALRDELDALEAQYEAIAAAAFAVREAVLTGHRILLCGNGGAAASADHMAEDLGRLILEGRSCQAICLSSSAVAITALANDLGFERVYSTLLSRIARPSDVLLVFSSSGESPNVRHAAALGASIGMTVVGVLGGGGSEIDACCSILIATSREPSRSQLAQTAVLHLICEMAKDEPDPSRP